VAIPYKDEIFSCVWELWNCDMGKLTRARTQNMQPILHKHRGSQDKLQKTSDFILFSLVFSDFTKIHDAY
jgi:hypothetical protein